MIPEYRSFTHNLTDPITSLLEYYRNSEFPNQDELMLNSGGPVTDLSEYSFLPCIQSIRILFFEPMSELEEGKSSALDGEINLGKNNPLIVLVQKFKNSGWETINQFEVETLEAAIEITESLELIVFSGAIHFFTVPEKLLHKLSCLDKTITSFFVKQL